MSLLSEAGKDPEATCAVREAFTLSEKVKSEIRYFGKAENLF